MKEQQLTRELTFLIEHLNLAEAVGDPDARWEDFQLRHLNNHSLLAIELKSRQVGWSWLAAAESIAVSMLTPRSTSIFVSINLAEAQEKIRYAKQIHEALDRSEQKRLTIDNRLEIEFQNGSRIISHPCRPVRGKAKAHLYLDEFAHYPNDAEIYQSALPVVSKGGKVRIGSSPLGARGRFWEIYTEAMQKYPGYLRRAIPWWSVIAFCKDIFSARKQAPEMATRERVYHFGTQRLIQIFENSPLDDFQQEYECAWLDETISWIDWELIKRNQAMALNGKLWYQMVEGLDQGYDAIGEMAKAVSTGIVETALFGGFDVGRKKDRSELVLLGEAYNGTLPFRMNLSLDRVEFDDQQRIIECAMDTLPIVRLNVDETGIGMQLAENLNRLYGDRVIPTSFSNASKQLWAVDAKLKAQRAEVPLPIERDFTYQIHSIKKKLSGSQNLIFDNEASDRHHADKFWAWALAINAATQGQSNSTTVAANPLAGYRG